MKMKYNCISSENYAKGQKGNINNYLRKKMIKLMNRTLNKNYADPMKIKLN